MENSGSHELEAEKKKSIKKKPGPKGKSKGERLDNVVGVRLNESEYRQLVEELKPLNINNNLKISDLIRLKLFPKNLKAKANKFSATLSNSSTDSNNDILLMTTALNLLIKQLTPSATNINQIVKRINISCPDERFENIDRRGSYDHCIH